MTDGELRQVPLILTKHAIDRIKERFNLSRKVAKSLVAKALEHGAIMYQKSVDGEASISILHHEKLFKIVIKEEHLLCTTAHPMGGIENSFSTHLKGKKISPRAGVYMKAQSVSKRSKFKPKGNH